MNAHPTPTLVRRRPSTRAHARGMATLTVVAVLFFILSLVAAYTNRNLIFEQRTSGNQVRSTLAFEAAEAGVEWALSMLNSGRIDDNCTPSTDPARPSFRGRYLSIDPTSGVITPAGALAADNGSTVWPSCVFNGNDWNCSCPTPGNAPALAAPAGTEVYPAFRVRFVRLSLTQPSIVRIEVNGCTRLNDACLDFPSTAVEGEGRVTVSSLIALRSALPAPPVAALTARQGIDVGGSPLGAFNPDADSGGLAVVTGGVVAPATQAALRYGGAPGAPDPTAMVENDAALLALGSGERLLHNLLAAAPDVYRDQPATVRLDCSAGCTAADIRTVTTLNPGRIVWADGDVDLDSGAAIGTAAEPVVLVGTGLLTVDIPVVGLVLGRASPWVSAGAGSVQGAVVAENALGGTASFDVVRDAAVLARLRWTSGSFVRAPGGWRDF